MRNFKTLLLTLIFSASFLIASGIEQNGQKIFDISSTAYKSIKELYISAGYALPSTTGPWSGAELSLMLERISKEDLTSAEMKLFNKAWEEIHETPRFSPDEMFGLGLEAKITAEASVHSNPDAYSNPDDYNLRPGMSWGDYNLAPPILSIPFETWIGTGVYGYMSLDLMSVRNQHAITSPVILDGNTIGFDYEGKVFRHNLIFIPPNSFSDFNMNFPYRAIGSFGGDWWNVSIGRDKLRWGPGETGNLMIGDQIPYHNNARVTFFTDSFKYTYLMSAFIHPMNYMTGPDNNGYWYYSPEYSQLLEREGLRIFIAHRLEWRILNKVNMALTEAIMYQNEKGMLDPLVISPTAIFHNFYIRGNANSLLSFEIDWAVVPHWNIYAEIVMDEVSMPGEYSEKGSPPTSMGYIVGTKFSYPQDNGVFYGSIETAYTNPYLYLRDDGTSYEGKKYGNSFVIGFPEFVSEDTSNEKLGSYNLQYLGYRYGGDSIVANLNAGFESFGGWYAEGNLLYLVHGAFDSLTRWMQPIPDTSDAAGTPTSAEPSSGSYDRTDPEGKTKNAPAHYFLITLEGGFEPIANLCIYGRADLVLGWNKGNIKGIFEPDFQFTAGLSYTI